MSPTNGKQRTEPLCAEADPSPLPVVERAAGVPDPVVEAAVAYELTLRYADKPTRRDEHWK